ncbi:cupin domain-containing protein [Pseudotabrizicola sp. 4114]|uniref:cupin domain-containing protein n=1 Tax=Pseudotabrizicola sp. 4114 TaxID=2817731 RepID=UPI00285DC88B|nr:putative cupin superfamily protein [Pseudorhodobacter sp. 4114]
MSESAAYQSNVSATDWEPFAAGEVHWIRNQDGPEGFSQVGLWRCTPEQQPGVYEAVFEHNETIHLLKGRIRVEIVGGPVVELSEGGIASFVKGTTGRWFILEPMMELFIYH